MGYYKRIRDLREDHDLTQRQLAAKLGMTQTQYFRYEQGYRDIPSDILIALADLYQTSTDYILGRTDDPRFFWGGRTPPGDESILEKNGRIWYTKET